MPGLLWTYIIVTVKKKIRHVFSLRNFTRLPDRKVGVRYEPHTPNTSVTFKGTKPGGHDDTGLLVPLKMQQENNAKIQNRNVKSSVLYDKYYQ